MTLISIILSNSFLMGRGGSLAGIDIWLAFIKRTDIIGTIILTALVTVMFVYWQRGREQKVGRSGRMQS